MARHKIVAQGLQARTTITKGKKCLCLSKIEKGKRVIRKKIPEITQKETKKYKLIGKALGQDLFHCLYLASKHAKNFTERVAAYALTKTPTEKYSFAIAFYEKKKAY